MYEVLVGIQGISMVVLFLMIFHIWEQYNCKEQMYLIMSLVCVLINLFGYLMEMLSQNMEMAIASTKVSYLGKCFLGWFMFMFIVKFCEYHVPKAFSRTLLYIHLIIFIIVFTCDRHNLYYTDIKFSTDMFPHIETKNGIVYYINMVIMIFYALAIPYVCFYTYAKLRYYRDRIEYFILGCIGILQYAGIAIYFAKVFEPYDITYLSFFVSIILLAVLIYRYKTFDMVDYAKNSIVEELNQPVIVFNVNLRILYTNSIAKKIFPGVETYSVYALDMLKKYLVSVKENYLKDGRYYEPSLSQIYDRKKLSGYILIFTDITEHIKKNVELVEKVEKQNTELEIIQKKIIISFANMIELRDDVTGHHVKRTSAYVKILVEKLMEKKIYSNILTEEYAEEVVQAAPLHDIGKIAIDDSILKKPGKLTSEEFQKIKEHSSIGGHMLEDILQEVDSNNYLTIAKDMAYYHHERWDGSGYPLGLSGENIPLCARIMAIADVFDALTSKRTYKEAMPYDEAFEVIRISAGSHFDPLLVETFLEAREEIMSIKEE